MEFLQNEIDILNMQIETEKKKIIKQVHSFYMTTESARNSLMSSIRNSIFSSNKNSVINGNASDVKQRFKICRICEKTIDTKLPHVLVRCNDDYFHLECLKTQ